MRIFIHDYGRYPYPWELARTLAQRGHNVLYTYSEADTARTTIQISPAEQANLNAVGINIGQRLLKSSFVKRRAQEVEHGRLLAQEAARYKPDVVISANTPLDAQALLMKSCRAGQVKFVFWVQDVLGVAIHKIVRRKLPVIGEIIGRHYIRLERSMLARSDEVVLITEDFRPLMHQWGLADEKLHVVENWAPLAQLPALPKDDAWLAQYGLQGKRCILYAGTMGMKHNPELMPALALRFRHDESVRIVLASEGSGSDWLRKQKEERKLDNLLFIPFQPFDVLPRAMASAEVLAAVLEPSAGVFSVPSKVLTYLCAGRPLLLAVPPENLAAKIVAGHKAGMVVPPTEPNAFAEAAQCLLENEAMRQEMGGNARRYAETHFDIEAITDQFEALICR